MKYRTKAVSSTLPAPRRSVAIADGSKRRFVEAQPLSVKASQVVKRARAEGISISESYVYNVRAPLRRQAAVLPPPPAAPTPVSAESIARVFPDSSGLSLAAKRNGSGNGNTPRAPQPDERTVFIDMIFDMGFTAAQALFDEAKRMRDSLRQSPTIAVQEFARRLTEKDQETDNAGN